MVKFSDSHKAESGNYFDLGIHKVQIMLVEFGLTEEATPREYVDFTVVDPKNEDLEAKARLWFTTDKAIKYTFGIIRGIFVHNTKDENKDKIREKLGAVKDTKELEKLCQMLIGKEAWLEVSEDPSRTYETKDADGNPTGEFKPSINRNITGYEPTPKKVSAAPAQTKTTPAATESDEEVMADFEM